MNATASAAALSAPLERRPHKATRAVVETLGEEAPRALYRAFDAYNAEHFAGALGAPLIFLTQTSGPRALGDYIGRDVHGLRSRVRIAPGVVARGELFALDVLLHEMVHAWASEVASDPEHGYRGHGPVFAAKCNEIGAKLGLPPVGVKGRKGLPDCAQWPLCVRPAGYYPTAAPPKQRRSKAPRTPTSAPGEGRAGAATAAMRSALVGAISIVEDMSARQRRAAGFEDWLTEAKEALA
jgi:hypothetical protein